MKKILALLFLLIPFFGINAQQVKKIGNYNFTEVKDLGGTSVKNQNRSGTCWSFSCLSFFESELLRMGKGEHNLSEMFIVRNSYFDKAKNYVRWHGNINFAAGGEFHDVVNVIKNNGLVPDEAYPGMIEGDNLPVHNEMDAVLKAIVEQIVKNPNGKLSNVWQKVINSVLDTYLGKSPESFTYNGKNYNSMSFAKEMGINPDDYIEITSYTHHPFYEPFVIEVPDNWAGGKAYNVPIEEFAQIIEGAIKKGYTVAWGSDVSDNGFAFKKGVAIVPEKEWADMEKNEKDSVFNKPITQRKITQEARQMAFDNFTSTDDHGMHIVGLYTDDLNQNFYKVKNSWGTKHSDYDGYFYASESYILLGTTMIMVNKNAIPRHIAKKLNL